MMLHGTPVPLVGRCMHETMLELGGTREVQHEFRHRCRRASMGGGRTGDLQLSSSPAPEAVVSVVVRGSRSVKSARRIRGNRQVPGGT
jgi:hypothetical protein